MLSLSLFDESDLSPAGYRAIGSEHWWLAKAGKYDRIGAELIRNHYSRRTPGSAQFMPPGETIVLISRDKQALWGWWRPHPRSGIRAMNGHDGWTCTVFARRREATVLASELVLSAERALAWLTEQGETAGACGPSGMLTYVWPKKVQSPNPGYCFKVAGWRRIGRCAKNRKDLLWKPMQLAGTAACGARPPC